MLLSPSRKRLRYPDHPHRDREPFRAGAAVVLRGAAARRVVGDTPPRRR